MGRHAEGRRVVIPTGDGGGSYVRKPRFRYAALTIVTRLWTERNAGKPRWAMEPLPTRGNITRRSTR